MHSQFPHLYKVVLQLHFLRLKITKKSCIKFTADFQFNVIQDVACFYVKCIALPMRMMKIRYSEHLLEYLQHNVFDDDMTNRCRHTEVLHSLTHDLVQLEKFTSKVCMSNTVTNFTFEEAACVPKTIANALIFLSIIAKQIDVLDEREAQLMSMLTDLVPDSELQERDPNVRLNPLMMRL